MKLISKIPFILYLIILLSSCANHPSDEKLINNFTDNKEIFEDLIKMFLEDNELGRVGDGFTRPSDPSIIGIDINRINLYYQLFKQLGIPSGIEGYGEKEKIWLIVSTAGLSISGSSKGYVYSESSPDKIVDDLDSYWSSDKRSFTAYRKIDNNWYLFFEYED